MEKTKKILIVEDECVVAMDLAENLKSIGYNIAKTVISGEDAIAEARNSRPDLILMDIMLKGKLNGIEAAQQIKQELDIPVIFLTAYSNDELITKAKAAEPVGYIIKPFNWIELKTNIEIALLKDENRRQLKASEEKYKDLYMQLEEEMHERQKTEAENEKLLKNTLSLNEELKSAEEELIQQIEMLSESQKAVTERELKFKNLIYNSSSGIFFINTFGKVIEVNKRLIEIFEVTSIEKIKKINILDFKPIEEAGVKEQIIRCINENCHIADESAFVKKSGKLTYLNYHLTPIKNINNKIIGVLGEIWDVSHRKESEMQINYLKELLFNFINSSKDFIFIKDENLQFIMANEAFLEFAGKRELDDIMGLTDYDILNVELADVCKKSDNKTIESKQQTLVIEKQNGHIFETKKFPINLPNNKTGVGAYIRDVTEIFNAQELKKEKEIALETAKIKQNFLANMSHEMRTPMTGIIGMIDFLLQTPINAQQLEYVNIIKNSAERLLTIINDVLIISKIEAGKITLSPITFDIRNTIHDITCLFRASIKQKNLNLEFIVQDDVPQFIYTDENKLKQIINNLLSNAIKFTDSGSVKLKISVVEKISFKIKLKFEVEDTGIGIKEEDQKKLFNSFTQIDSSNTRNYDGTGLGLTISKKFVELMNGEIGIISHENEGSTFWFTINASLSEKVFSESDNEEEFINHCNLNGKRVLLVEDKYVNSQIISMMIEKMGGVFDVAKNGVEAINKYRENQNYDIILMDIQMPEMDGITATIKLKEEFDDMPPIIALTAYAFDSDVEHFLAVGMDDFISKPIKLKQLCNKFQKWIKN